MLVWTVGDCLRSTFRFDQLFTLPSGLLHFTGNHSALRARHGSPLSLPITIGLLESLQALNTAHILSTHSASGDLLRLGDFACESLPPEYISALVRRYIHASANFTQPIASHSPRLSTEFRFDTLASVLSKHHHGLFPRGSNEGLVRGDRTKCSI